MYKYNKYLIALRFKIFLQIVSYMKRFLTSFSEESIGYFTFTRHKNKWFSNQSVLFMTN